MPKHFVAVTVIALLAVACGDDAAAPGATTTSVAVTSTLAPTTTTTTTAPTTTVVPESTTSVSAPECDESSAIAVVDAALVSARLTAPAEWAADPGTSSFAPRTTTASDYAARLGLECGALLAADDGVGERLAIVAWTGTRAGFAIQSSEAPAEPFRLVASVRNPVTEERGEFLDDSMSTWATTADDGSSIVLGHVDFSLGAAAKGWDSTTRPPPADEINLAAEQHGIDALTAAGMRNVGIAQPPELGSEEGYLQFVSPSGQISVADVAPTDWFDPMQPRYYTGETTIEDVAGEKVRVSYANPDDNLGFTDAAEVGFACAEFVWILEPPFNGTVDEMLDTAGSVIRTDECAGR